jgi:hypothetical protein
VLSLSLGCASEVGGAMRRVTKREQVAEVITNFDAFPKVHNPNHHRLFIICATTRKEKECVVCGVQCGVAWCCGVVWCGAKWCGAVSPPCAVVRKVTLHHARGPRLLGT